MSSYNPSRRPTAKTALERFRALRPIIPSEKLLEVHELELIDYYLVPRGFIVMFRDLIETGKWTLVCQFTWISFKMWCVQCAVIWVPRSQILIRITKTLRLKPAVQL